MNLHRTAAYGSLGVVAVAVIAGALLVGSPEEQRLLRFDRQRVTNLQLLVRALDSYWEDNLTLPTPLDELVDGRRLSRLPLDPTTDIAYEYQITGANAYRLCADFSRPSADNASDDFWSHATGSHCYSFDLSTTE